MGKNARDGSDIDYRAIVESQSGLLCRFRIDGTIIFANHSYAAMRNHSPDAVVGSNFWELMAPEDRAAAEQGLSGLSVTSPRLLFEERIPSLETEHWILWNATAAEFAGSSVSTIQASGVDITERKQTQIALEESEARLRLALQAAHAGVWSMDLQSGQSSCSAELPALYGYPVEMFPNYERWIARVHPDDRERLQGGIDLRINSDAELFQHEFRIIHPQLGLRWILDIGRIDRDAKGKAIRIYGINMDVTERKRGEEALRESEARFRHLAEAVPTLMWASGSDGSLAYVNRNWTDYTGYSLDDMIALGWRAVIHPDDRESAHPLWGDCPGSDDLVEGEARFRRFDDEHRWHYFKIVRLLSKSGDVIGCYGASLDVHEHLQMEQALRDSEGMFRMIADLAPTMLWITDADGRSTFLSKGWYDFSGVAPDLALGWGWTETIHPDDRQRTRDVFRRATKVHEHFEMDYRMRRANGDYRWVLDRGRPRFGPAGDFLGFVGSVIDVHERTQVEDSLRESEERFRTLADNMSQLSWMADNNGQVFWLNRRWYEFTGSSEAYSVGSGWLGFIHPDHQDAVSEKIQHCWQTGDEWEDTFLLRCKSGRYHWFLSRALPIRDQQGLIIRWFGTHTDVTAQRAAEEASRIADQRKTEFLATLAHELRSPLAPLRNGLEIMQLAADNPEAIKKAQNMMQRQLGHMVRLIDDLLDLSRISRGKIHLNKQRVALLEVIDQAVETSRPKIEADGLQLHLNVPNTAIYLDADPTRLTQIFANLFSNSAKFTQRGGAIWLTVKKQDEQVCVSVRDNGIGMPKDLVPQVFEMFTQGERSLEATQGGLGVGLSLVKGLVEMHGGSVQAHSDGPGLGSEFTVTLPLVDGAADETTDEDEQTAQARQRRHILVVDDNPDSAASMATMLELLGDETRIAHDGLQALADAAAFRPDIVLLDIGMPKLNGYEVAKRIRQEEWGETMLLVALTGWGQDEDRRRSKEAGFDYHLVKPADLTDIQDVLQGRTPRRR